MEILVALVALVLFDIATWRLGVDSRESGRDPRSEGRPDAGSKP
ncbi:MAG: hypothetical protein WCC30_02490 [Candidatus Dormiibacterota bacterium]